ncbi:hypothetical protein MMC2321_00538 [Chitinophaga sp. MM2321]
MAVSRLEYLFNCYVHRSCTIEEEKAFMELLDRSENEAEIRTLVKEFVETADTEVHMDNHVAASILQNILQKDKSRLVPVKGGKAILRPWMQVAAAALLLIAGGILWSTLQKDKNEAGTNIASITESNSSVGPGGDHALLTMADGSTVVLDSVQNGSFGEGSAKVTKQNGVLIYTAPASTAAVAPVSFNTLATPRGGEFKVVLPDGSKVWLNAASSLRFPTVFAGRKREVELTGEAYFEIAKNKEKPFQVKVGDMSINVLGTHFNVNAYMDDDAIKTSLIEGSVKITKGKISDLLKPGEQAVLRKKSDRAEIRAVNMDEVVAWKNGLFEFDGVDISIIMSQISRWYDVDVVYTGKVPEHVFEGKISRDAQLSDVLKILELSNVKFTVEGKTIFVH